MKRIIVGTAGHIDHGKTSLIKAITGVDADRLKEEKERGITIDIGFADLSIEGIHFSFVDVPGHERFIKNMLAGAHGIDLVMLVVAADEGVMPQTREHFDICQLLGVKNGIIVLTKIDMVDDDMLELVESDVTEYVHGSFLENTSVIKVSSITGFGIDVLMKTLVKLTAKIETRDDTAITRMPVDRVFTVKGFGTVVTGTLISGTIRKGDEIQFHPFVSTDSFKVRNIQTFGKTTNEARAGERAALNLQGINVADVKRGLVVSHHSRFSASSMLDVKLNLLDSAPRVLKNRSRMMIYIGTAEIPARVVILDKVRKALNPGESAFAQLRLETPILAVPDERFIIRIASVTVGGGIVIDSKPKKHKLRDIATVINHIEKLAACHNSFMRGDSEIERAILFVEMSGESGISYVELAARTGSSDELLNRAVESMIKSRRAITASRNPLHLISKPAFDILSSKVRTLLKDYHKRCPLEAGMPREELKEKIFAHISSEIFKAVINSLTERNEAIAEKDLVRLATHRVALSPEEEAAKINLSRIFEEAKLAPMSLNDAVAQTAPHFGIDERKALRFAQMLITSGDLVRIADLIFHRSALDDLVNILTRFKQEHGSTIDVASFKDITGVSRKYAIPLLEYLDRKRVTRRVGDCREIL